MNDQNTETNNVWVVSIIPAIWPKLMILLDQLPEINEDPDMLDPEPLF